MVTTDQPPDEAEGSFGSSYVHAAENFRASPQHQTVDVRGLGFYRFPTNPKRRRQKWISAVNRKGFTPNEHTRLCGEYFVAGNESSEATKIDSPSTDSEKAEKCSLGYGVEYEARLEGSVHLIY
eukprot:Em0009g442a